MNSRRTFLTQSAAVTAGFLGLDRLLADPDKAAGFSYGPLAADPDGLLDLPDGFRYQVLSRTGDRMGDGYSVPGKPDGMAAFDLGEGRLALVRNHEIGHSGFRSGPFPDNTRLPEEVDPNLVYDPGRHGAQPFVGGTSTVVYDYRNGRTVDQYLSLVGTDRNCAGGPTPWGSWITCEEPSDTTSRWGRFHGYCFEVPAGAERRLAEPTPLRGMGRFRHEAVAVDPRTGIVYLTEDRNDGVIYRFLPSEPGKLAAGGRLQALRIEGRPPADTRNWPDTGERFPRRTRLPVEWIDLEGIEAPEDDLRYRARERKAALFARAEGMWFGGPDAVDEASIYWACTSGGREQLGQIFRYFPSGAEGTAGEASDPGELELYLEPNDDCLLQHCDNITITPWGHLYICEDSSGTNRVRGVSRDGEIFDFARNALNGSEFAGVCFSPDGSTLFVNIQNPGITFAVTGPFTG